MPRRKHFDQLAKQLLTAALQPFGTVRPEVEIVAEAQSADVEFLTSVTASRLPGPEDGLLGQLVAHSCLFEAFHQAPTPEDVLACLGKFLLWQRASSQRGPHDGALWLLCGGRPTSALTGLGLQASAAWPAGVYLPPDAPALRLGVVVLSELPRQRSTLLLRLLGAGAVLRDAARDLADLPGDAPERQVALPVLTKLRFEVPTETGARTPEEEEFVMTTQELFEQYQQNVRNEGVQVGLQKGRQEGRQEGLREAIRTACELLDLPLTEPRQAQLLGSDEQALTAMLTRLRTQRRWD